jgi:hypothetical protein
MQIEEGATYRTHAALWTVERISLTGEVFVRRDDGTTAVFGLRDFAGWVIKRIA